MLASSSTPTTAEVSSSVPPMKEIGSEKDVIDGIERGERAQALHSTDGLLSRSAYPQVYPPSPEAAGRFAAPRI